MQGGGAVGSTVPGFADCQRLELLKALSPEPPQSAFHCPLGLCLVNPPGLNYSPHRLSSSVPSHSALHSLGCTSGPVPL